MCGINFILDKNKKLDEKIILKMNEITEHRGPDFSAYYKHENQSNQVFFGHNRLKIIDLSDKANQPIFSDDKRYILVYNGEIYNFQELKKELENTYNFRTQSDTELLLYWLIENKDLNYLNGMYAFVFYDTKTQNIRVGQDPFSIKPIYKFENEDFYIVSSELKAIHLVEELFSPKSTVHSQKFINLHNNQNYELKTKNYKSKNKKWAMDYGISTIDYQLKQAIKHQLIADVPIGLFLSGGVDSTLILAICQELGLEKMPTFTITYPEKDKSFGTEDYHYAREASKLYNSQHYEVEITENILDKLPEFIQSIDHPFADGASLLTFYLSKQAKKQVKVALSGIGADELFAGYNRHWAFAKYLKYYHFWRIVIPLLKRNSWLLPDGFSHPLRKYFRLVKKFINQIDKDKTQTFLNFANRGKRLGMRDDRLNTQHSTLSIQPYNHIIHNLESALLYDQTHFLKDILLFTDNTSMQHSLELRVPYLDNNLVALARKIPSNFLLKNGKKWILKELLKQRNGHIFTKRRKEGFGVPLGHWLRQQKYRYLFENLFNKNNSIFENLNFTKTQKVLKNHFSQQADYSQEIWVLLIWDMWHSQNLV